MDTTVVPVDRQRRRDAAITMLFEQLVRYDDGTNPVPGLAEAMPVISEDGRTYRYTLRDGVSQWTFRDCSGEG